MGPPRNKTTQNKNSTNSKQKSQIMGNKIVRTLRSSSSVRRKCNETTMKDTDSDNIYNLDIIQTKDRIRLVSEIHDIDELTKPIEHLMRLIEEKLNEIETQKTENDSLTQKIKEMEEDCSSMREKIRTDKKQLDNLLEDYDDQINDCNNIIKKTREGVGITIKAVETTKGKIQKS
jgi:hypothetical protein